MAGNESSDNDSLSVLDVVLKITVLSSAGNLRSGNNFGLDLRI